MLGHLRLQQLLQHPLDDLLEKAEVVQQDLLRHLGVRPTMLVGHRRSVSDRLPSNTNHLGGRSPFFLAAHQFTELYGHNQLVTIYAVFTQNSLEIHRRMLSWTSCRAGVSSWADEAQEDVAAEQRNFGEEYTTDLEKEADLDGHEAFGDYPQA
jgi:hypothetical protein